MLFTAELTNGSIRQRETLSDGKWKIVLTPAYEVITEKKGHSSPTKLHLTDRGKCFNSVTPLNKLLHELICWLWCRWTLEMGVTDITLQNPCHTTAASGAEGRMCNHSASCSLHRGPASERKATSSRLLTQKTKPHLWTEEFNQIQLLLVSLF